MTTLGTPGRGEPPVEPLTYTVPEVAAALGISRATVYAYLNDGTIPSVRLRGRRLIRRQSLEALLERLEQEQHAERRPAA